MGIDYPGIGIGEEVYRSWLLFERYHSRTPVKNRNWIDSHASTAGMTNDKPAVVYEATNSMHTSIN